MNILRLDYSNSALSIYVEGVAPLPWQVGQQLEPFTIPDERWKDTLFPGGLVKSVTLGDGNRQEFTRYLIAYPKKLVKVPIPMEQPTVTVIPAGPPDGTRAV